MNKRNTWIFEQFRKDIKIIDNNMFVTNFVLYSIFECFQLGTIQPNSENVELAIDAILEFQDKNQ